MRMSSIFKATIIGYPSDVEEKEPKKKKSIDYISGEIGVVLDIFSKKINIQNESSILNILEGYAFDSTDNIKIKLTRHHYDTEYPRTEIQVFAMNEMLEDWWDDIQIMADDNNILN